MILELNQNEGVSYLDHSLSLLDFDTAFDPDIDSIRLDIDFKEDITLEKDADMDNLEDVGIDSLKAAGIEDPWFADIKDPGVVDI